MTCLRCIATVVFYLYLAAVIGGLAYGVGYLAGFFR